MDFFKKLLEEQYDLDTVNTILSGLKNDRVMSFRVNTLKTIVEDVIVALETHGVEYTRVVWYESAFVVDVSFKGIIESMDIYRDGHIYVQSLSSMLPPLILGAKENKTILDMCASPGGKTTELAVLTNNKAQITALEMNKIRLEKLKYNVDKQGAKSVYIMNADARTIDDYYSFDCILLDAPCSGSGTIDIEGENTFKYFTMALIEKSVKAQKSLLNKALNVLKKGETMVYSTCSILRQENEDILSQFILDGRCEVVPIEEDRYEAIPKLPTTIDGVMCVAPSRFYEGFFVAKLRKIK